MDKIQCHFCGRETAFPKELDQTYQCQGCGSYYEAALRTDTADTSISLGELIAGELRLRPAIECFVEQGFDSLFTSKREAKVSPQAGEEVVLIWARKK